jgi:hypothetical protein
LSHDRLKISASFDDPNLVSRAGLVPVMGLAERAGLFALTREQVRIAGPCGAYAGPKTGCLVAGMAAGADSIDDLDVLRHGAMAVLFDGCGRRPRWGRLRSFTGTRRGTQAVGHVHRATSLRRLAARWTRYGR